eukprot:3676710-Pyramimonas_sp.AAC.1
MGSWLRGRAPLSMFEGSWPRAQSYILQKRGRRGEHVFPKTYPNTSAIRRRWRLAPSRSCPWKREGEKMRGAVEKDEE